MVRVAAALQRRAARRAVLVHVVPVEVDAHLDERVEVGRGDLGRGGHVLAAGCSVAAVPAGVRPPAAHTVHRCSGGRCAGIARAPPAGGAQHRAECAPSQLHACATARCYPDSTGRDRTV